MVFLRRTTCFYCHSAPNPHPPDTSSFRCPHCGCWNRYDASGEILSDEPAMHDEKLNTSSFAKRGLSSPSRAPSSSSSPSQLPLTRTDSLPRTRELPSATHVKPTKCSSSIYSQIISHPPRQVPPQHPRLPPASTSSLSQHPDYALRLDQLPAYRESLHARYPPVCANCLPAVESEIEQKDHMARTRALAGWLNESKGKERQRLLSSPGKGCERLELQLAIWRVRGALWCITLLCVVVAHGAAIRGYDFPHSLASTIPALPALCLFSFLYTAWDPTYYHFKKARVQGRDVRIEGRPHYIVLQVLAWLSRFATSVLLFLSWQSSSRDYLHITAYPSSYRVSLYCSVSLVVELLVFASSFTILHLQQPPTIRLIGTSTRSSVRETPESSVRSTRASPIPAVPVNNEPDLLASLTLSSKPLIPSTNLMFGHPSLASPIPASTASQASPIKVDETLDEDAMDWTPTNPSPVKAQKTIDDDGGWLRPQRFFPPERPTGLESLFANTKLDDGDAVSKATTHVQSGLWTARAIRWWMVVITVILVPLGTIVYHRWIERWIQ